MANKDFGKVNKLASPIYGVFKELLPYRNRESYQRLIKTITRILHSGPKDKLGKHKLRRGELGYLVGHRLHPYTLLENLFKKKGQIRMVHENGSFVFSIPAIRDKDLAYPERATSMSLTFCCITIAESPIQIEVHRLPPLVIPLSSNVDPLLSPKKFRLSLSNLEGKIVLFVASVRTTLRDTHGDGTFLSGDRKHYAGEVIAVGQVRKGKWVVAKAARPEPKAAPTPDPDFTGGTWEDEEPS